MKTRTKSSKCVVIGKAIIKGIDEKTVKAGQLNNDILRTRSNIRTSLSYELNFVLNINNEVECGRKN